MDLEGDGEGVVSAAGGNDAGVAGGGIASAYVMDVSRPSC